MKIGKSSLAAALLEIGEENAAVLLIRSPLPDQLDTERDLSALTHLGLDPETVEELVATAVGARGAADDGDGEHLRHTISRRYADLVQQWVSSRITEPS